MSKINVGLLTFHKTSNFGAVLQTVSTVWALESLGCDCTIIDYSNDGIIRRENPYFMYRGIGIKTIINRLTKKPKLVRKFKCLSEYLSKNAKCTKHITKDELEGIVNEFDLIMAGSDMLWNLNYTNNDYGYFLDFVSSPQKKVAFATSAGMDWEESNRLKVKECLEEISYIAVREESLARNIFELTGKKVKVVCDPTMLIENQIWDHESIEGKKIGDKYYLIYMDDNSSNCYKRALRIAQRDNVDLYEMAFGRVFKRKSGVKYIDAYTISDFLSLIKNASMIFTASYHGMLFAIYFHVPLIYANKDKMRLQNIAEYFGIEKCNVENNPDIITIDWDDVDRRREELKSFSKQVLFEMTLGNRED